MTNIQSAAEDAQHDRLALVGDFVKSSADYYRARFHEIGSQSSYIFSFNLWAFLLGPIWFSARSIWNWGLAFLILETFGWVQIIRGAFGDLAAGARERMSRSRARLFSGRNSCRPRWIRARKKQKFTGARWSHLRPISVR